jgi:hypothetical protein
MKKFSPVSLQNKIVIFSCVDDRIKAAVQTLKQQYEKEGCEVLVIPSAGGGINVLSERSYFIKQINTFIARGYTGFVFVTHTDCRHVQVNKMMEGKSERHFIHNTLFDGIEIMHEEFHHLAFEGWNVHTDHAVKGLDSLSRAL